MRLVSSITADRTLGPAVHVLLNGAPATRVLLADEERGLVLCESAGTPGAVPECDLLEGDVTIVLRSDAPMGLAKQYHERRIREAFPNG
jgi:hypothetical protein